MQLKSCPGESDPREKVGAFVSDDSMGSIGGYRLDGLQFLKDLVVEEIRRQEPDSKMVELDRDFLSDHGIDFERDLTKVMDEMTSGDRKVNWIVFEDLPVMGWQMSLERIRDRDTQVYLFTTACRQVPCCFKLIERSRGGDRPLRREGDF